MSACEFVCVSTSLFGSACIHSRVVCGDRREREREREGAIGKEGGGSEGGEEVRGRAGWMCLMVDLTRRLGAGI